MKTILAALALLVLPLSAPAFAEQPDWSQLEREAPPLPRLSWRARGRPIARPPIAVDRVTLGAADWVTRWRVA
jgi:hypothetical protein